MIKTPIQKAVDYVGSQVALASALDVTRQHINRMVKKNRVPVEQCIKIETVTDGYVPAWELRPDIFPKPKKSKAA